MCVIPNGSVRAAAAAQTPLPAWQQVRWCVMEKACVSVERAHANHRAAVQPVRTVQFDPAACAECHVFEMGAKINT